MRSTLGMAASSSVSDMGTGTSSAVTRTIGASSQSKAASFTRVNSSLRKLPVLYA